MYQDMQQCANKEREEDFMIALAWLMFYKEGSALKIFIKAWAYTHCILVNDTKWKSLA